MIRKVYELIHDREIELRERLFRVILLTGLLISVIAILASFKLENVLMNTIPLLVLVGILLVVSVATFKYHKIELSAVLVGVLIICGVFPHMFFISGGISGGATVWFVLGILYIFLMFSGKKLGIFLALVVVSYLFTYILSYMHPEYVVDLTSRAEVYYDSIFAVLAVGIAVGCIMKFQLNVYKEEREVAFRQKEELEELSNSKMNFFSYVSHEIRTPINTIIGLNEMILREDISDEVEEDAKNVRNASKILLSLVNDVLDLTKMENKRMELIPVKYKIRELFSELAGLISVRMKEKNLEFSVDIDANLPSVLYGDEKRLKQVILNLLTNAVKYTEKGSVTLTVQGEVIDDTTLKMEISVSDTGVGIRREDMKELFDTFKRADLKKNRTIEGNGLGLSIVNQLVGLMNGEIKVDSIYGKGSIFTVILEQKILDMMPVGVFDAMMTNDTGKTEHYRQSFEAPEAKILIVDDDEKNLMVACKLLRATKVSIDTATSGEECLEYTKNTEYHVILLDYRMPEMDGVETLQRIKRQENGLCSKTPVIVLTGDASPEDEQQFLGDGFDGYLAKPVEGKQLEAEILRFLPREVIEYQADSVEQNTTPDLVQRILRHKRKKIMITSDCASDLPKDLREKYNIHLMYTYIMTEKGSFRDTEEIGTDNFFRYMSEGGKDVYAVGAPVEEYGEFYSKMLLEAENIIHISLSAKVGTGCGNAKEAAKEFYHVHVIDSEFISGGEGLLVLYAAKLAKEGHSVEEICKAVEREKKKVEMRLLLPSINTFYKNGYVSETTAKLCKYFNLYPIVKGKHGKVALAGVEGGKIEHARRHYIKSQLFWKSRIDTDIIYITHTGYTVEEQKEIQREVEKWIPFKRVVMQRCTVSIASNAGMGVVGIAYVKNEKQKKREFFDL